MTTLAPAVTVCVAAAFAVLALAAAAGDKAQAVGNPSPPPPGPPGWSAFCSSSLSEQRTEVPLVVNGSVPGWLRGSFMKNAAGRYEVGPRSLGNLQDGFAKVYRFRFEGGHVFFNTKFLRTAWYEASLAAGTVAPMMVISPTTPLWSVKETTQVLLTKGNNPNIVLWPANPGSPDGWIALGETLPHLALNVDTLDTNGVVNHTDTLTKKASVVNPMSPPHPRRVPANGNDTVSFFITPNPLAFVDPLAHHTMTVYRMNTSFHRSAIATIDLPKVNYIHSFSVTQTRVIIFAYPFYYKFIDAPLGAYVEHFLTWDKHADTKIYVVDLATGQVAVETADPTFCFHHVNAWDDGGGQGWVVDALCYDPAHAQTIMSKWDVTHGEPPAEMGAMMRRYTSPGGSVGVGVGRASGEGTTGGTEGIDSTATGGLGAVPWRLLSASQFELPRINDNLHLNRDYCVIYGWTATAIIRVDICANTTTEWKPAGPHQYPSEAIFVPRASIVGGGGGGSVATPTDSTSEGVGGRGESDGVVVAVVFDGLTRTSSVVLFDPTTLAVLATAGAPVFTPFSIHGAWNPAAV